MPQLRTAHRPMGPDQGIRIKFTASAMDHRDPNPRPGLLRAESGLRPHGPDAGWYRPDFGWRRGGIA